MVVIVVNIPLASESYLCTNACFSLSLRDVETILAQRGVVVSYG